MAMETVGYAALQIIPSMDGITGNMQAQFAPFVQGATRAGQDAGRALVTGVQAAQAQVARATDVLAKSHDKVADAAGKVRVAELKLEELRNSSRATASQIAAAEERLETARRGATTAAQNAERATSALADAERDAANATDEVVRSGGGLSQAFSGLGGGVKQMAALTAGAAGLSGAFALVGSAIEKEMGADKLAASLGATPELAAEYGAAASKAYAAGAGSSLGEVQNAVGLVQSSFSTLGFEGDLNIDEAATAALSFADIFDTDIASSVQAASTLVTSGLADRSKQAFDLMTTSFQKVPAAMRDELPEIIQEYGTNFRALGFDGEEAFNLLVSAAGQGKFALDKTGDALKEFTIRGSDMSKSSVGTYETIGLDAELMASRIAAGGDEAQLALQETAAGLLKIEDPAQRANAAIALFGTPLEDLSVDQIPAFLQGLSGAEPAMAGFEGSLDSASSTMYDNFGSKMEVFKRGFQDTFVNLVGDSVLPMLGDFSGALEENEGNALAAVAGMAGLGGAVAGFEQAKGVFDSVSEGIGSVKDGFASVKETAQGAWEGAKKGFDFAKSAATATADFAKTAASATVNAAKTSAAWVASSARTVGAVVAQGAAFVAQKAVLVASTVATAAATAAQWALNVALNANPIALIIVGITALVGALIWFFTQTDLGKQIITAAWEGIQTAISFAWNSVIKPAFDAFVAAFVAIGDGAMWLWNNAIVPAWNGIQAAIGFAWTLIQGYFNLWKAAFTAIGDAAMWLWNNAILPAFDGIKFIIGSMWDGVNQVFTWFMDGLRAIGDAAMWLWNTAIVGAFDGIKSVIGSVIDFLQPLWDRFTNGLSNIGDMAGRVGQGMKDAFSGVAGVIKKPINMIGGLLAKIPDKILGVTVPGAGAIKSWGQTLQALRSGGQVAGRRQDGMLYGPGTGTSDSILGMGTDGVPTALVSAKEFVVNAAATAANLPLLRAINSGAVSLKDLASGKFTAGVRNVFGLEEDDPKVRAILGIGDLLRGNFTEDTRKTLGVEEDNPAVTAFMGVRKLLRLAGGGLVDAAKDWAVSMDPASYDMGGFSTSAIDCSGFVSGVANVATGNDAFSDRMSTMTEGDWLVKKGFELGAGSDGDLRIGWFDRGGGANGHTAGTFPDGTNFESNGSEGVVIGGPVGWDDPMFDQHAFLPGSAMQGGDLGETTFSGGAGGATGFGGGASGGGGSSSGGGGGFKQSSLTSSGASFMAEDGSVNVSPGDAVPVWVVNWPESVDTLTSSAGGSTSGGAGGASGGTSGDASMAVGGAATDALSAGAGDVGTGGAANLTAQEAVMAEFAKKGWGDGEQWAAAEWIIGKESGWKLDARNPESGAFGLFQFLGSTKDQYLPDESMDPTVQGAAGAAYIGDRYGDPLAAKKFWEENGWYDQGGTANGKGAMLKNVIQPEAVLSPEQTQAWLDLVPQLKFLVPVLEQFNSMAEQGTGTPDNRAILTQGQTFTAPAAVAEPASVGGTGVDESYGVSKDSGAAEPLDFSDGLASLPDIEAPKTGDPNVDKWTDWAAGLGNDVKGLFNKENMEEMLGTVVGLGLGGAGMAKYGGGDTYQITEAQNGRDTARAVSRVQRRRALAQQRGGGFGR